LENKSEFDNKKDDILVKKAQAGSAEAIEEIITRYKPVVSGIARRYFLIGGETEDLIQEGMMGLFSAIQTYNQESKASFKTFATLLIKRKVQTSIKTANRQKNKMLNYFMTINNQGIVISDPNPYFEEESEDKQTGIYLASNTQDPEKTIISKETVDYIKGQIESKLTLQEKNVLQLFAKGKTYEKIANELNLSKKAVDNTLFKIRQKLAFLKEK
jgi:RNA polymerase sporulation-specific sigma factor